MTHIKETELLNTNRNWCRLAESRLFLALMHKSIFVADINHRLADMAPSSYCCCLKA